MMQGVMVLQTYNEYISAMPPGIAIIFILGSLLIIGLCLTGLVCAGCEDSSYCKTFYLVAYSAIGSLFLVLFAAVLIAHPNFASFKQRQVYKAYLTENLNIEEFNQKYEILEQEGLIYKITEREVEE